METAVPFIHGRGERETVTNRKVWGWWLAAVASVSGLIGAGLGATALAAYQRNAMRYEIAVAPQGFAYRLDRRTGEVQLCLGVQGCRHVAPASTATEYVYEDQPPSAPTNSN